MSWPRQVSHARQEGMLLLQSLVALALFSVGALAVLMLSAGAMRQSAQAHYRTAASVLAMQMVSHIRLGPRDAATLTALSESAGYHSFRSAAERVLPGAGNNPPQVTMDSSGRLAVTVRWQAPGDASVHQYVATTQIVE